MMTNDPLKDLLKGLKLLNDDGNWDRSTGLGYLCGLLAIFVVLTHGSDTLALGLLGLAATSLHVDKFLGQKQQVLDTQTGDLADQVAEVSKSVAVVADQVADHTKQLQPINEKVIQLSNRLGPVR